MLWDVTWQRISGFLPNLKDELFKHEGNALFVRKKLCLLTVAFWSTASFV